MAYFRLVTCLGHLLHAGITGAPPCLAYILTFIDDSWNFERKSKVQFCKVTSEVGTLSFLESTHFSKGTRHLPRNAG